MNTEVKVSVLTPIYNHDIKYLRQCLESLSAQTMQEIEFILIDNGATVKSQEVMSEFEQSDMRFRVIHLKENLGYAKAVNIALEHANGIYIGFVDSDDWIAPDMYKKLYEIALNTNAQVIKSEYYDFNSEREIYINKFPKSKYNKLIYNLLEVPQYLFGHTCFLFAIYKKDFLVNSQIKFNEMPESVPDISFMYEVFLNAKSIYIIPEAFYHYRSGNPNSMINSKDRMAWRIAKEQEFITSLLKEKNVSKDYWDLKILHDYDTRNYNYYNRCKKTRLAYIKAFSKVFSTYKKDKLLNFRYFTKEKIKNCRLIIKHPYLYYIKSLIFDINYSPLGNTKKYFFVYKTTKEGKNSIKKHYIFGIPIYQENINHKCSLLEQIFSAKNEKDKKIIRILGFKLKLRRKTKESKKIIELLDKQYSILANLRAIQMHPSTFGPFKNINLHRDAVIIGGGQTVEYFVPLKNVTYTAVNNTCAYDKVKFDYIFLQEMHKDSIKNKIVNEYNYEKCTKFYGIIPEQRLSKIYPTIKRIPQSDITTQNIKHYYLDDIYSYRFAYDLTTEPIGDFGGTIFSAFQFVLWTNPARIFIVGADCNATGNAFNEQYKHWNYSGQLSSWQKLKQFADDVYPKTEIISVNPIGLKGLFKDVYTKDYVKAHPELFEDLSDIEFLEDIIVNGEVCHV